jgi:glycosyltransferase involved in cell wall biosynthesis
MTLKVVQLDPCSLTPYYNVALCNALAEANCYVRYVTSTFLYDLTLPHSETYYTDITYFSHLKQISLIEYPLRRRAMKLFSYWRGHQNFLRSLVADRPDVVHIQWCRFPLLDHPLVSRIQALDISVVHTVHDVHPLFWYAHVDGLAAIYSCADRLIVHSASNRKALITRYPQLDEDRIRVISHIAPTHFSKEVSRSDARKVLKIPENAIVALFYGSIRPYKSIETLIEAYLLARRYCPNLWIVVAGRLEYTKPAKALRKLHSQSQSVIRLEYIPADQTEVYHRAADVAVFPYQSVSQSGALITAMGFGLPVIVTNVGAMPETIDGNGWIVPPNDADMLAKVLVDAACDPVGFQQMGQRSLSLIRHRHSPALVAQQTISVYRELMG